MAQVNTRALREVLGQRGYIRGPFGSALRRGELSESGIPVYEQQHAITGTREFRFFINHEKFQELARFQVRPNDLIISCSGTVGRISIVQEGDPLGIISQALLILRPNPQVMLPEFLYYFLNTPQGQHNLLQASHGSVQVNIAPREVVERIQVPDLPLDEQCAIAAVLGALDDKIELNHRMNQTLEQMAQALFKSWFVDFDPVHANRSGERLAGLAPEVQALFPSEFEESELGVVPKGWRVNSLDNIADFLNGLALQKFPPVGNEYLPVIKIAELRRGVTESSGKASPTIPNKYIIDDGDVLFSWSGSLEVVIWCGGRGALNQHLFKVTSANYPKWFYYLWTKAHLSDFQAVAASKATTMGHIQRHHLTAAKVLVPPPDLVSSMTSILEPLLERIVANNLETRTLSTMRDVLLPTLLSGEVRVRDAEHIVEELM